MKTLEFHFIVPLPEAAETSEHFIAEAKRLKARCRELLLSDPEFAERAHNFAVVIKPSDIDREWGAVDRWVIDE